MGTTDNRAEDLDRRWRLAREAALARLLGEGAAVDDEAWAARLALSTQGEAALRTIYDHGLRLGQSFARFHGSPVSLADLPALLAGLSPPCLRGEFSTPADASSPARLLERAPCTAGPDLCDYWREALAGLVHGLGDGVLHTRLRSAAAQDVRCLDVLHLDADGPWRAAPLAGEALAAAVGARATLRLLLPEARVDLLGTREGALLYSREGEGCGEAAGAGETVEGVLRRFFPGLALQDVSPRAVLGPQGDVSAEGA